MPKLNKKIDLAAEAENGVEVEGLVDDEVLFECCPKAFLAELKKAKTPAQRADLLYKANEERLAQQKVAEATKKFVTKLEKWFIQELPEVDSTGIAGKLARVQIKQKERPVPFDWTALYAYIKKNNAFEMLDRKVNSKAAKERWEAGKEVPGVKRFRYKDVSITKVSK